MARRPSRGEGVAWSQGTVLRLFAHYTHGANCGGDLYVKGHRYHLHTALYGHEVRVVQKTSSEYGDQLGDRSRRIAQCSVKDGFRYGTSLRTVSILSVITVQAQTLGQ